MTTPPLRIAGYAGSLRQDSLSKIVLNALMSMLPAGTQTETLSIGEFPFYNQDLETTDGPAQVIRARRQVAEADALLMVVPEFNHGIPGGLKNALDWLSRPAFHSVMAGKPVFFVTLSQGMLGGVRAQYQMRETLASMLCQLYPLPEVVITYAGQKVTEGRLTDEATCLHLNKILQQFLQQVNTARGSQ
ncbi:NADPH-dependent FMN reductase [Tatumella sp. UBA2305]|uniref:NADPH-dependent FMN reductase n=1 Tax=Tatumella sp. UBA2305 TaxID=1947647 RepID=UPI0025DCDC10|nr:NADPH-dependent FMN reductase [Tatumella sp. UBA2305]